MGNPQTRNKCIGALTMSLSQGIICMLGASWYPRGYPLLLYMGQQSRLCSRQGIRPASEQDVAECSCLLLVRMFRRNMSYKVFGLACASCSSVCAMSHLGALVLGISV